MRLPKCSPSLNTDIQSLELGIDSADHTIAACIPCQDADRAAGSCTDIQLCIVECHRGLHVSAMIAMLMTHRAASVLGVEILYSVTELLSLAPSRQMPSFCSVLRCEAALCPSACYPQRHLFLDCCTTVPAG